MLVCCPLRFSITNSCRRSRLYDCMLGYDAIVTMCMMLRFRGKRADEMIHEWTNTVEMERRDNLVASKEGGGIRSCGHLRKRRGGPCRGSSRRWTSSPSSVSTVSLGYARCLGLCTSARATTRTLAVSRRSLAWGVHESALRSVDSQREGKESEKWTSAT